MLMLELLLGFTAVTVTALGGALGTERTQADTTRLKSESCALQGNEEVMREHETREANTCRSRKEHRANIGLFLSVIYSGRSHQ